MKKRDIISVKTHHMSWGRVLLLLLPVLLLPVVLPGVAWKILQLQKPVVVQIPSPGVQIKTIRYDKEISFSFPAVKPQKTAPLHQLLNRLVTESQKHPFASSISISQITPWPQKGRRNLDSKVLFYNQKKQILKYDHSVAIGGFGWTWGKVRKFDLNVLTQGKFDQDNDYLPTQVEAALRQRGCIEVDGYWHDE